MTVYSVYPSMPFLKKHMLCSDFTDTLFCHMPKKQSDSNLLKAELKVLLP